MGSRETGSFCLAKFLFISLFLISKQAEASSCFLDQQLDILQCINQRNGSISIDRKCCKALNRLVQAGVTCLCSLITARLPLPATPISISLSDCYISPLPLISCQGKIHPPVSFSGHIPASFSPDGTKEINRSSPPKPVLTTIPERPAEAQGTRNSSRNDNPSSFKEREKGAPVLNLIYRGTERCQGSGSRDRNRIREFPCKILWVSSALALNLILRIII